MELSILVATVPSRRATLLSRLLATLELQLQDQVEVILHRNEDKLQGIKYDELYQAASGRLSVQVDDDDMVSAEFVDQILAVSQGHDFVGYKVDVTLYGEPLNTYDIDPVRARDHRVYAPWDLVRHVTPKCPVLTELARCHPHGSYYGADWDWSKALIQDGYPFNPVFIPKSLYWYDCWPNHTLGASPADWTPQREVPIQDYDPNRFTWIE